jgi:hypothetical protein
MNKHVFANTQYIMPNAQSEMSPLFDPLVKISILMNIDKKSNLTIMYYLGLSSGCPICFIVNINEHSEVNLPPSKLHVSPKTQKIQVCPHQETSWTTANPHNDDR